MKNIVSVATLLVASTVLANAAEESATKLLWAFNFTNGTLQASTGKVESLSGSGTISTSDGWTTGVGSYAVGNTYANVLKFTASGDDTSNLAKQSGAFSVSFHVKTTGTSADWPVIASFGESNQYCLKLDDSETSMNGTLGLNADGYTNDTDWTTARSETKDLSSTGTWHHIVITYNGSNKSGTTGATLYLDGVSIATASWTSGNDSQMKMFSFGGRLDNSNNTANVTLSDLAIYSGVLTTSQINYLKNNIANDTAIPEPSAFGLLAGLGAIALVVSRRRRKH